MSTDQGNLRCVWNATCDGCGYWDCSESEPERDGLAMIFNGYEWRWVKPGTLACPDCLSALDFA